MGNVCQNQRDQEAFKNSEKSPKKLQAHMKHNQQNYAQQDPTQSEIREFMTDLNSESVAPQQILYMSSEFEKATQKKVSINDFRLEKVLGKGSFGKVMLVTHIVDEKQYAMKVLLKKSIKNERQKRHTMTERQILEKIDYPFIVKLHYAFQTNEKLYLVLDFMVGGELFHHLKKSGKFTEEVTRFYAAQIVLGLEHLHEMKIIYRDLKPENILLDSEGNLKLADFGLSKMGVDQNAPAHSLCGTPEYLAPEIITSRNGHDKTVDWWSFGALIYEMLTGSPPFYSNNKKQMLQNIIYKPIPIPKSLSERSKSFLQSLLVVNPAQRLGFGPDGTSDVKSHPFFATVDWEAMRQRNIKTPLNIVVQDNRDTKYFDPYILRQQPVDTPASYNQDFFKFSQFTYNKKMEEVQMGEMGNEADRNGSNEYFDLKGMGQEKQNETAQNGDESENSEIQRKKVEQVLNDETLSQEGKTPDQLGLVQQNDKQDNSEIVEQQNKINEKQKSGSEANVFNCNILNNSCTESVHSQNQQQNQSLQNTPLNESLGQNGIHQEQDILNTEESIGDQQTLLATNNQEDHHDSEKVTNYEDEKQIESKASKDHQEDILKEQYKATTKEEEGQQQVSEQVDEHTEKEDVQQINPEEIPETESSQNEQEQQKKC